MKISGWNNIPEGYGLTWDLTSTPFWLRVWVHCPLIDRLAFPLLIRRRVAWLVPHPDWPEADRDPVPSGWLVRERSADVTPLQWKNHRR